MQDVKNFATDTPILDSGVLPPVRRSKRTVGIIIGFCVGILFVVVVENVGSSQPGLALLFYFTILALAVILHEFGHLVAGWAVGFHFSHISIGPLTLKVEYGRLKVQFRRDLGALGYAGMHIETVKKARRHLLIFAAAGPVANLATGMLALLFIHFAYSTLPNSWVVSFAAGFSVLSFVLAAGSLIPYGPALRSDGARMWMLLTSRNETRRWISSCMLGSQQRKGISPKHWKETWLKAACCIRDGSRDEQYANLLAYVAASDRKDISAATSHLERSLDLSRWPLPAQRDFLAREASFFCAWIRGDHSLAEQWLAQVRKPNLAAPLLQIRTKIALDSARLRFDSAFAGWQQGAELIQKMPDSKAKRSLERSWQEWSEEIRGKQSQTAPVQL